MKHICFIYKALFFVYLQYCSDYQRNNFQMKKAEKLYLTLLGEKIRLARKEQMTQGELAKKLGTKHTQIGRIERGEVNSTILMLRKIAAELGISVSKLVNINDEL